MAAGIVRWVRGEEYGGETLVMDDESRHDMDDYLAKRIDRIMEPGIEKRRPHTRRGRLLGRWVISWFETRITPERALSCG